jgi:glycosyltransferase involved in cell wall biosynthesis
MDSYEKLRSTLYGYYWWYKIAKQRHHSSKGAGSRPKERRICLLAWAFPPNIGGGVFRPMSIAKYLGDFGWRITVFCAQVTKALGDPDVYLRESLPENVQIYRLREPPIQPSYRFFPHIDGGFINVLNTFTEAIAIFGNHPPAITIATGPPFHNFVAGFYIAKFFRSRLILDYRDDWSGFKLPFVDSGKFDRFWEKRCLKAADRVFLVTEPRLEYHLKMFPFLSREKCYVIPNGWEPEDFSISRNEKSWISDDRKFVLAFIGRITPYSFPQGFLYCLDSVLNHRIDLLDRISIHLLGSSAIDVFKLLSSFSWSNKIIKTHDHVTKPLANRLMMDASALLIINDPLLSRWLPGKLYEYLAASPPILVYGCGGEIPKLVSHLNAGIIVPMDDADALELALDKLIESGKLKTKSRTRDEWLRQHTRKKMVERMAIVFNQLLNSEIQPD